MQKRNHLKILSVNTRKSNDTCINLLNDIEHVALSFLLLSEPWARQYMEKPYTAPKFHSHWLPFFPSILNTDMLNDGGCFRSMIWVNKHHNFKSRQIHIQHPDLTAITASSGGRRFLIISVYIPCITNRQELTDFLPRLFLCRPPYPMQASVPHYPCITCTVETYVIGEFAT